LLSENRNKQRELNTIKFVEKTGIGIGDTIEWSEGITIKKGVVFAIKYYYQKPHHHIVNLFNADGRAGKREAHLWSNDLPFVKIIAKASKIDVQI